MERITKLCLTRAVSGTDKRVSPVDQVSIKTLSSTDISIAFRPIELTRRQRCMPGKLFARCDADANSRSMHLLDIKA